MDGEPVSRSVIEQSACDCGTQVVKQDESGRVLALGVASRFFNPRQHRAIVARDGHTCVGGDLQLRCA
ncbi:hypothetical protein GCM10010401_11850 [Rarobacter faecitabidus]